MTEKGKQLRLISPNLKVGVLRRFFDKQRVEVYRSGKPPVILGINDTLDGGAVLPAFASLVSSIFAE